MKKLLLSLAVISSFGLTGAATAATIGASGLITFNGSINAETCSVTSDDTTGPSSNMVVDMGSVSLEKLGTEGDPAAGGPLGIEYAPLTLKLKCTVAAQSLSLKLTPTLTSGRGIGLTSGASGAQNVQIMLVNQDSGNAFDFTSGSAEVSNIPSYAAGSIVSIPLRAYYTRTLTGDPTTGLASGSVAYELSYD